MQTPWSSYFADLLPTERLILPATLFHDMRTYLTRNKTPAKLKLSQLHRHARSKDWNVARDVCYHISKVSQAVLVAMSSPLVLACRCIKGQGEGWGRECKERSLFSLPNPLSLFPLPSPPLTTPATQATVFPAK